MKRMAVSVGMAAVVALVAAVVAPRPVHLVLPPPFEAQYDLVMEGRPSGSVVYVWRSNDDWVLRSSASPRAGGEGDALRGGYEQTFVGGVATVYDAAGTVEARMVQGGRLYPGWWWRVMPDMDGLPRATQGNGDARLVTFRLPDAPFQWTFSSAGFLVEARSTVDPTRPYRARARWIDVDGIRVFEAPADRR
ncbi:MAG: hypothetical protein ACI9AD_000068 [Nitriliruptoraceae bacterium]|jgi:hypothetical protein